MNGTPRLRSAYPNTPQTRSGSSPKSSRLSSDGTRASSLPEAQTFGSDAKTALRTQPKIPLDLVDAAQQRLFAVFIYLALWSWRLLDAYHLDVNEDGSLWMFMKWSGIDVGFLILLSELHIPWLDISSSYLLLLSCGHAILNGMLMFRIGLPLTTWIFALARLFYDRELAISEHSVKAANIQYNPNLILGKQVVHILPEG